MKRALVMLATVGVAAGCGEPARESGSTSGGGRDIGPTHPCPPGERVLDDGSCRAAGLNDAAWAPGVPEDGCGAGFVHDGDHGCDVVLPEVPCEPGSYAVPGDSACRRFDDCGADPWPAVAGDVIYVDAAYNPGNGDGSMTAPYNQLQAAIDAATDSAVIALAAGNYTPATVGKPLSIVGRCADMVAIVAAGQSALAFVTGASGGSVRDVALTGAGVGLSLSDAELTVERVWIHHTTDYGMSAVYGAQATSVALSDVLVESTIGRGVYAEGAGVTVDQSVVRDVAGRGINVRDSVDAGVGGVLSLTTTLVERAEEVGVMIHASTASIDNSMVRATNPVNERFGRALSVQQDASSTSPAALFLMRSNVEGGFDGGIVGFAASLSAEHVTVRDVAANLDEGIRGYGIMAQHHPATGIRSDLTVTRSLVERCHEAGVSVVSSDYDIDGMVVRDNRHVLPTISDLPSKFGGRGFNLQSDPDTTHGAAGVIRGSLIDANDETGIVVEGSVVELIHSIVQNTRSLNPHYGRGLVVQNQGDRAGSATVVESELINNTEVGLFVVGSDARMHSSVIRDTAPRPDGDLGVGVSVELRVETGRRSFFEIEDSVILQSRVLGIGAVSSDVVVLHTRVEQTADYKGNFGDGVVALHYYDQPSIVTIAESLIAQSSRAGVATFGSDVTISSTRLDCNAIHLDSEPQAERSGEFEDDGNNVCGCDAVTVTCKALSSSLEPPEPPQL